METKTNTKVWLMLLIIIGGVGIIAGYEIGRSNYQVVNQPTPAEVRYAYIVSKRLQGGSVVLQYIVKVHIHDSSFETDVYVSEKTWNDSFPSNDVWVVQTNRGWSIVG